MDKFRKAGFILEEFGENTIKLTGVPNICLDLDTKETIPRNFRRNKYCSKNS